MHSTSTLILGGGVAGLASAWTLAGRGARGVVLLEREATLARHSSRQNAAILRTLDPDPLHAALCRRGAAFLWDPPRDFHQRPLVDPVGLVILASAAGASALRSWATAAGQASPWSELCPAELARLAPHWRGEAACALWFAGEGRLDIEAQLEGFERGARAGGVQLRCNAQVRELLVEGECVRGVRFCDGSELRAERTLLAAGAWAAELAASAGSPLRLCPTRRHLVVARTAMPIDPRWPVLWTSEDPFYARPEGAQGELLLCACDQEEVAADACGFDPAQVERGLRRARQVFPALGDFEPRRSWASMRTFSADQQPLVGPDPLLAGLYWCAALGGHGMTCASVLGSIAADWLLTGASLDPLAAALDPRRSACSGLADAAR